MRKNPHAVALGRRGGKANTKAQQDARRENGRKGGQPKRYRLVHWSESGRTDARPYSNLHDGVVLERRNSDRWLTLEPPYDRAAREALRRLKA